MKDFPISRRHALVLTGGGILAVCTSSQEQARAQPASGKCTVVPKSTEGPFYADPRLERADIRGGKTGTPLLVRLKVMEATTCAAARRARVDIWQCDATGLYSSFDGQLGGVDTRGQTFLRGHQFTDATGAVQFRTIWPGWYPGRAPHVHFKIFLENAEVLTAQLYFPDSLNAQIYAADRTYRKQWTDDARNDRDSIFRGVDGAGIAAISRQSGMMVASLDVGIARG